MGTPEEWADEAWFADVEQRFGLNLREQGNVVAMTQDERAEVVAFLEHLNDQECIAVRVAHSQLRTSYDLALSQGFEAFRAGWRARTQEPADWWDPQQWQGLCAYLERKDEWQRAHKPSAPAKPATATATATTPETNAEPSGYRCKLYDFWVRDVDRTPPANEDDDEDPDDDGRTWPRKKADRKDPYRYVVEMFGADEQGRGYCVTVTDYYPFFYVRVDDTWTDRTMDLFVLHLKQRMNAGKRRLRRDVDLTLESNHGYYGESIRNAQLVRSGTLYGFDNHAQHQFVRLEFANVKALNKVRDFWYSSRDDGHELLPEGYVFRRTPTFLYESNLMPLLRFFHLQNLSPSGWVELPFQHTTEDEEPATSYEFNLTVSAEHVVPLPDCRAHVPFLQSAFDIECMNTLGDFPLPVKTYSKLALQLVNWVERHPAVRGAALADALRQQLRIAFEHAPSCADDDVQFVEPKEPVAADDLEAYIDRWLSDPVAAHDRLHTAEHANQRRIEHFFEAQHRLLSARGPNDDNADREDGKRENKDGEHKDDGDTDEDVDEDEDGARGRAWMGPEEEQERDTDPEGRRRDAADWSLPFAHRDQTVVDVLLSAGLTKDAKCRELGAALDAVFPPLRGDTVTFIGLSHMRYGEPDPFDGVCFVLGTCAPVDTLAHARVVECATERDLLLAYAEELRRSGPHFLTGYNIYGFDYPFLFSRAQELDCVEEFLQMSRVHGEVCGTKHPRTGEWSIEQSSIQLASGLHETQRVRIPGVVQIDLHQFVRRAKNYASYKLDHVIGQIISDDVQRATYDAEADVTTVVCKNTVGLTRGSSVVFEEFSHSSYPYADGAKFDVLNVGVCEANKKLKWFAVRGCVRKGALKLSWSLAKDDVSPKDIFRLTAGSDADRAVVAKYCLQDCHVLQYLCNKEDVITGTAEMASVCSVPMDAVLSRGMSIKLHSFLAKECRAHGLLMPVVPHGPETDAYGGAAVLDPKSGMYLTQAVICNDYASLYPSSQTSENLSHDTKVWTKTYDLDGTLVRLWGNEAYDHLPGRTYVTRAYPAMRWFDRPSGKGREKRQVGMVVCRFIQPLHGERGILPTIILKLLRMRKLTRQQAAAESDPNYKRVLDARQLGYKATGNSLYGGCGFRCSPFYDIDVAACTTAMGQDFLVYGRRIIEECYFRRWCRVRTAQYAFVRTCAEYVYGDTDSVFYVLNAHVAKAAATHQTEYTALRDEDCVPLVDKQAMREVSIQVGHAVGKLAALCLKFPHDFEYEKIYYPYFLFKKKRYQGIKYDADHPEGVRDGKGTVMHRRDNAPIVKDVQGGCVDVLLTSQNVVEAAQFFEAQANALLDGRCPIEKLTLTKALRNDYAVPAAHKILADRIGQRDPGNKPTAGDRIPFVYVVVPPPPAGTKQLQGDRIETPAFIAEHRLPIDYAHYLTNQLMRPLQSLFAFVVPELCAWKRAPQVLQKMNVALTNAERTCRARYLPSNQTPSPEQLATFREKWQTRINDIRFRAVETLLFAPFLRRCEHARKKLRAIDSFFAPVSAATTKTTTNDVDEPDDPGTDCEHENEGTSANRKRKEKENESASKKEPETRHGLGEQEQQLEQKQEQKQERDVDVRSNSKTMSKKREHPITCAVGVDVAPKRVRTIDSFFARKT